MQAEKKKIIFLVIIIPILFSSVTTVTHCGLLTTLTVKQIRHNRTSSGSANYELKYILNIVLEFVNVTDTIMLILGVCRFFCQDNHEEVLKEMSHQGCCKLLFIVATSIIFSITMLVPPTLLSLWWKGFPPYNVHHSVGIATIAMDWIDFIYNLFARVAMIVATVSVREEWSKALKELNGNRKLEDVIDCYKKYGKRVIVIQNVFQAWFVAKWILYFTDILMFGTSALTQLTTGIEVDNDQFWFDSIHLLYDVVAFIIIYVCGSLMNQYHDNFYEELNEAKEEYIIKEKKFWIYYNTNLITKQSKYQFTPSLCGISVPMNNPGFAFTFIISLFAFIAKFLNG